jgi:hypothetical protein
MEDGNFSCPEKHTHARRRRHQFAGRHMLAVMGRPLSIAIYSVQETLLALICGRSEQILLSPALICGFITSRHPNFIGPTFIEYFYLKKTVVIYDIKRVILYFLLIVFL